MAKIEKLTPEQEADLPIFRQRYLDIALGGGRIERAKLQTAMNDAYAVIGKPAPALFIFDSPQECMLAIKIFQMGGKDLGDNLGANLWANLRANLGANLRANLEANLWANLGANLGDNLRANLRDNLGANLWANLSDNLGDNLGANLRANLWANLRANLWANLWANLEANLWDNLGDNLRDNLGANLRANLWANLAKEKIWNPNFLWGSQDLYWIAYYRFAQKIGCVFAETDAKRLDVMESITTQCEWWWPFEGIVFASQRPLVVRKDDAGRLHGEYKPALEYADGYKLYAWHGTNLPDDWVENRLTMDPSIILKTENVELRAAGLQCYGLGRMKDKIGKLISDSGEPTMGAVWDIEIPGLPETGRFLSARCPRNEEIFEGIPKVSPIDRLPIDTALAAQAWRQGFSQAEYQHPLIRT
jgi:hypothetical protein